VSHRVWLVRHGEPSVAVGVDPGLTDAGRLQAGRLPERLAAIAGEPIALRTSPLRRARETVAPLEAAWARVAIVDPAFRELPSGHTDAEGRRAWLQVALAGTFADLGDEPRRWRDDIVAAVRDLRADTVVTTHAVVVNAVTGWCDHDDAVLSWIPAHTSITEVHVADDGTLTVTARGEGRPNGSVV
jgi:broad specificity phosphatase PhoE